MLVLGSSKTASGKFFTIPGSVSLEKLITYKKRLTHPTSDESLWPQNTPVEAAFVQEMFSVQRSALI